VPTGTALFGASPNNTIAVAGLDLDSYVGGWTFNPGASDYTFSYVSRLHFTGAGIVVNGGSVTINGFYADVGILFFDNASTAGNAKLNNVFGLIFDGTSSAANSVINSIGGITFYNTSTAGNATITTTQSSSLNAPLASIFFRNSSTGGNASIFNNAQVFFIDHSTGGNASIVNGNPTAPNLAVVTDFSDSSGPAGDHKLSAGSIAGGGTFYLGQNELTVGANNQSTTVSGVITDSGIAGGTGGSLVKVGTGTLSLTGIDPYTGATTVNAGVLSVDGSIAASSLTTVNTGATLTGVGTVGNTTVNGGTLAPGHGTGTLSVLGDLVFTSAANYLIGVTPTAASSTVVTGTATLGGATVTAVFAPGTYVTKQYTIVNAGSVTGTFSSLVNTSLPSNFKSSLSYDANNAYLDLALNFTPPPGSTTPNFGDGLNINQQAVANALVNFFNTTGGIPLVFGTLTPAGLTQASGESATGSQQATFDAMGMFLGLLTDPFVAGRDGLGGGAGAVPFAEESAALAYATRKTDAFAGVTKEPPLLEPRWSVWAAGYGGSQTTSGNAVLGSNNTTSSIYGTAVGADYRFSPNTVAGFALAGGGTNFSVNGLGSGRSDLFQAGAFLRHTAGPAYLSAALAYGWQDITTNRTVTIAGIDQLRAEFNANAWSGRLEGGYRFVAPWAGGIGVTPYAAGQFTTFDLPAYAESVVSGAGTFALAYAAKSVTDSRSELGLRSDKSFAMDSAVLTLRGRFAWAHDFNPDRSIGATFQTLPGASFVVNGAAQASDSALTTAAVEMKWLNGWSAAATFEGEFSNVTRSYAGKGVVRYTW